MAAIADKHVSQLDRIKKNVRQSWEYSNKNFDRYHEFRKRLFETTIDENQETLLADQGKPIIEFNITMPFVMRELGEFSKHEPSIDVSPANGLQIDEGIINLVDGHLRHIQYEANKNSYSWEVFKSLLSGGFDVVKVYTDWESPMSFLKVIKKERVFDPTLCGFDPLARYSHKGDGQYCFELFPMTYEDFKRIHPGVDIEKVKFLREMEGFNWSYLNQNQEPILLTGEYFEKRRKKAKIVQLANGRVMTDKNYQKLQAWWEESQFIEQVPAVIGKSRTTELEVIDRYCMIETEVFEYKQTDYCYLPLVYVAGNSVILQQGEDNNTYEFSTPYTYHAKGIQDLKNFAGQSLGQYLDNLIQSKFIVKKEAIPQEEEYQESIRDHQHANTVVVQAFLENDPSVQIPEPIREIQNVPAPPEVMGTFAQCDQMLQSVLGTYDASLGLNDKDISGVALIEAATQNNATTFPYLKGYLQAETQCANIIVDLMPKYLNKKQKLPIRTKDNKKDSIPINGKNDDNTDQLKFDYSEKALNVEVTAGVNLGVAKNKALTQIFAMMQASPTAAEFFSTEGFPIVLDNMDFHGSDIAKEKAEKWLEEKKNAPQQPSPEQLQQQTEFAKLQQKNQELQTKSQMHQSQIQIDMMKLRNDQLKLMKDMKLSEDENKRENTRAAVEHHVKMKGLELQEKDMEHSHNIAHHDSIRESIGLHHEIQNAKNEKNENVEENGE